MPRWPATVTCLRSRPRWQGCSRQESTRSAILPLQAWSPGHSIASSGLLFSVRLGSISTWSGGLHSWLPVCSPCLPSNTLVLNGVVDRRKAINAWPLTIGTYTCGSPAFRDLRSQDRVKTGINGYPHITPEILKLIAEIDEFKGRWKVMESLAPAKEVQSTFVTRF